MSQDAMTKSPQPQTPKMVEVMETNFTFHANRNDAEEKLMTLIADNDHVDTKWDGNCYNWPEYKELQAIGIPEEDDRPLRLLYTPHGIMRAVAWSSGYKPYQYLEAMQQRLGGQKTKIDLSYSLREQGLRLSRRYRHNKPIKDPLLQEIDSYDHKTLWSIIEKDFYFDEKDQEDLRMQDNGEPDEETLKQRIYIPRDIAVLKQCGSHPRFNEFTQVESFEDVEHYEYCVGRMRNKFEESEQVQTSFQHNPTVWVPLSTCTEFVRNGYWWWEKRQATEVWECVLPQDLE